MQLRNERPVTLSSSRKILARKGKGVVRSKFARMLLSIIAGICREHRNDSFVVSVEGRCNRRRKRRKDHIGLGVANHELQGFGALRSTERSSEQMSKDDAKLASRGIWILVKVLGDFVEFSRSQEGDQREIERLKGVKCRNHAVQVEWAV